MAADAKKKSILIKSAEINKYVSDKSINSQVEGKLINYGVYGKECPLNFEIGKPLVNFLLNLSWATFESDLFPYRVSRKEGSYTEVLLLRSFSEY